MSHWHGRILIQILVFVWPACSAQPAPPQHPEVQSRILVEVNEVTVPVTVRGPRGTFLADLPQDAFRVFEDGREQEITSFSRGGVPLTIAFVLDTSKSVASEWADIAEATQRFVQRQTSLDRIALVTFNDDVSIKLGWGLHSDKIAGVLASIVCTGRTALWDAVGVTSQDYFRGIHQGKIMILMTDGIDNASKLKFEESLDAAIRSEARVYIVSKTEAVRYTTLNNKNLWIQEYVEANLALQKLAAETGGRVLDLDDSARLENLYRELQEELRSLYTIRYVSNNAQIGGTYRHIKVLVDQPDAIVGARAGYLVGNSSLSLGAVTQLPSEAAVPANAIGGSLPSPDFIESAKRPAPFQLGREIKEVTVPVTVRNPAGSFVKGLPQSAFRVLEDGYEQPIVHFSREAVPVHVALVLDTSANVRNEWGTIKNAANRFAALLHPEDQFALVTFADQARLKIDWGTGSERLDAVLGSIYCRGGARIWDALWLAATEVFKGVEGKKAVLVMSDGLDNGSSVSYEEMRNAALRSKAIFYVISRADATREAMLRELERPGDSWTRPWETFSQAGRRLRMLAEETGGRLLAPDIINNLSAAYQEVYDELRNQYTIEYTSTNSDSPNPYHRIQVFVDRPNVKVYSRPGYLAPNRILEMTSDRVDGAEDSADFIVLEEGTPVFLRVAETITSEKQVGDLVPLEVYRDVKVGNLVVLAKGSHAWATVDLGTHPKRYLGIGGTLVLEVHGAHAVTGHTVDLRAYPAQRGEDIPIFTPYENLLGYLAQFLAGRFPRMDIPLSLLAKKGLDAVIPKGTFTCAYVGARVIFSADLVRAVNNRMAATNSSKLPVVHIYGKDYQSLLSKGRDASKFGKPAVSLDGREVAKIPENRFLSIEVTPGIHTFKTDRSELQLDLASGQEVYLRLSTEGQFLPKGRLQVAAPEQGEEEMYRLAPVDEKEIRNPWKAWRGQTMPN